MYFFPVKKHPSESYIIPEYDGCLCRRQLFDSEIRFVVLDANDGDHPGIEIC
jgi:hypothetical protein